MWKRVESRRRDEVGQRLVQSSDEAGCRNQCLVGPRRRGVARQVGEDLPFLFVNTEDSRSAFKTHVIEVPKKGVNGRRPLAGRSANGVSNTDDAGRHGPAAQRDLCAGRCAVLDPSAVGHGSQFHSLIPGGATALHCRCRRRLGEPASVAHASAAGRSSGPRSSGWALDAERRPHKRRLRTPPRGRAKALVVGVMQVVSPQRCHPRPPADNPGFQFEDPGAMCSFAPVREGPGVRNSRSMVDEIGDRERLAQDGMTPPVAR